MPDSAGSTEPVHDVDPITVRFSATSHTADYRTSLQALSASHDCPLSDRCVTLELHGTPSDGRIFQACHAATDLMNGEYGDNKPSCVQVDIYGGMAGQSVRSLSDVEAMRGEATDVQAIDGGGTISVNLDKDGDGSSAAPYELLARTIGYLSLCAPGHTLVLSFHPDRNLTTRSDGDQEGGAADSRSGEISALKQLWTDGTEFAAAYEKFFRKVRNKVVLTTDIESLHGVSDWSGRNWNGVEMDEEERASTRMRTRKYKYKP